MFSIFNSIYELFLASLAFFNGKFLAGPFTIGVSIKPGHIERLN